MQIIEKPRLRRAEFATFGEFLSYAENQVPSGERSNYRDTDCRSWAVGNTGFHHTKTFAEAESLARRGWHEGASQVAAFRDRLGASLDRAVATVRATEVQYDVTGLWADVGRVATGEPECCGYEAAGTRNATRVIPLRINVSSSHACTSDEFLARGAVTVAVIDTLESLGDRVALSFGASAKCGRTGVVYEFVAPAKEPDQPLDLDRLAFFLAHPAALRRYGFSVYEKLGRLGSGLPQPFAGDAPGDEQPLDVPHIRRGGLLTPAEFQSTVAGLCRAVGVEFAAG
jgi:hypothetical protein